MHRSTLSAIAAPLLLLAALIVPPVVSGADGDEEEDDFTFEEFELVELTIRCRSCHLFTDKELETQSDLARRKHGRALKRGKFCVDCHEGTEVCCHARQFEFNRGDFAATPPDTDPAPAPTATATPEPTAAENRQEGPETPLPRRIIRR